MSRPATLKVGNTSYWTIMTYTSAGVLVDADSTPTVAVYKNGTLTVDVVTVTKRSATTGIYDASYNPASESEGDCFTIQETATISSQDYVQSWNFEVFAAERGTDNASPTRYYTFADSNGIDYVDVYTDIDVAKNLPKVQKAIVRLKLSGNAASSSDWRLKLHVPSGNPASGFDLLDGVTLPASVSNYILQAEVDITACDNVDGIWSIVFEDFNAYGSVLSIDDAAVEFSDVPVEVGDATAASQTAISNAIAALNDFDPASDTVANVTLVATTTTNSDMRGTDGANTVAPDNAGIAANGTAISSLNNITVQEVWDALESGTYASGSFGERLLVSQGTHRTVQVTGSNHVAADVHEFQNDSITASAIAVDAVTELQTGLVTVGTSFTYTNGAGDTHNVTIS